MPKIAKPLTSLEVRRLTSAGLHAVGTVPGLHLDVRPTGSRAWMLRVAIGGKRRDIGLGAYPGVSLAQAWDAARTLRSKIAAGDDPLAERRQQKLQVRVEQARAVTFDQVVELFLQAKRDEWTAKHGAQWPSTLSKYASPEIGKMRVGDVDTPDVLRVLDPIWRTKNVTATRVRQRIETVLSFAMQRGLRPRGLNPAAWKGVLDLQLAAPGKLVRAERFPSLPYRQLWRFVPVLRASRGIGARALEFLILTGMRSGSVLQARWSEIDFESRVWSIPAASMKMRVAHRVPLSRQAIALLENLSGERNGLLFPPLRSQKTLSDMTLSKLMKDLHAADVRSGGVGFLDQESSNRIATPHGFRATIRTWGAECTSWGAELWGAVLAHKNSDKVDDRYQRGELFEKRAIAMQEWADFCDRTASSTISAATSLKG